METANSLRTYIVMERAYNRERPIYESNNQTQAEAVAAQHSARRVVVKQNG